MALKDHPVIHEEFKRVMAQKEAIHAKSAPVRAKYEAASQKMEALRADVLKLGEELHVIEAGMPEIEAQLARLAMAAGGRTLSGR